MAELAATPARVQVKMVPPMEDWVDENGRLVIIGEAAHPLPVLITMTIERSPHANISLRPDPYKVVQWL